MHPGQVLGDHFDYIKGTPTRYVFAGNLRIAKVTPCKIHYFHKDHLGSSTVISTASGKKADVESTAYLPYGGQRGTGGISRSSYRFTDQEFDGETGLYNYDARLYDSVVGVFVSADSIVSGGGFDPQMLNGYAYVRNNPLIYIDPSGHHLGSYKDPDTREIGTNAAGWDDAERDIFGEKDSYYTQKWGSYTAGQIAKAILNIDYTTIESMLYADPSLYVTVKLIGNQILDPGDPKNQLASDGLLFATMIGPSKTANASKSGAQFGKNTVGAAQRGLPEKFTRAMKSRAERIATGRDIRKVDELVEKFGGKAKNWKKMKTTDDWGQEIHYYEHHGIGKVGIKFKGDPDPF